MPTLRGDFLLRSCLLRSCLLRDLSQASVHGGSRNPKTQRADGFFTKRSLASWALLRAVGTHLATPSPVAASAVAPCSRQQPLDAKLGSRPGEPRSASGSSEENAPSLDRKRLAGTTAKKSEARLEVNRRSVSRQLRNPGRPEETGLGARSDESSASRRASIARVRTAGQLCWNGGVAACMDKSKASEARSEVIWVSGAIFPGRPAWAY